jgi:hypothetical protein
MLSIVAAADGVTRGGCVETTCLRQAHLTARKIAAELAAVEPEIAALLARQREIAARLRELLSS